MHNQTPSAGGVLIGDNPEFPVGLMVLTRPGMSYGFPYKIINDVSIVKPVS